MIFTYPLVLWGLLLGLLPILIHLFNRLRHRKLPWAAMMFLRMANRKSTRYAKVRQWLVLLFRVLVLLALIFALSRPSVGGWLGGMVSGKPDVILIVLDRSASMGADGDDGTRLKESLDRMIETVKVFGKGTRLVLLEHTGTRPQEIAGGVSALETMASTVATDTAADLPTLLEAAVDWFDETQPGKGEIWIATDLQATNWDPAAKERWRKLTEKLDQLNQSVAVRLMALKATSPKNVSVRVVNVIRHGEGERAKLNLQIKLTSGARIDKDVGVAVYLNGKEDDDQCNVGKVDGATHVFDNDFDLPETKGPRWGYVELVDAEDGNVQDNRAYFVYGDPSINQVAVVGDPRAFSTRFFKLASAPDPANKFVTSEIIDPSRLPAVDWADYQMVIWQGKLPSGNLADKLTTYVEDGGMLVCFADNGSAGEAFHGVKWGDVRQAQVNGDQFLTWQKLVEAEEENDHFGYVINNHKTDEGPFKRTEEGLDIRVNELRINRYRPVIHEEGTVLANIATGETMVLRHTVGKGQMIYMGTQPSDDWSSLTEGLVVVPMLERLLVEGEAARSGRFINQTMLAAGDDRVPVDLMSFDKNKDGKISRDEMPKQQGRIFARLDQNNDGFVDQNEMGERWVSVDTKEGEGKDFNTQAGVYRYSNTERLVAVNRPEREDALASLEVAEVRKLFGSIAVAISQEKAGSGAGEPREIWKWFLVLMILALLAEGLLILPKGADERVEIQRSSTGKVTTPQAT